MDIAQKRVALTSWMDNRGAQLSPAQRAMAIGLAAAWLREHEQADLSKSPLSDVPQWLAAATAEDKEAMARLEEFESRFEQKPPLALIAADADQIQAYVFESAKIPEVRGASALVESLNLEGLEKVIHSFGLPNDVLVYQGGGGAMLLVPAIAADEVQRAIEEQFVTTTHVATITTVSREVWLRDLVKRDRFRPLRAALIQDLQIRKLQKESPLHFEWLPFARRCQVCEVRPASERSRMADRALLCTPCARKRLESRRQPLLKQFAQYLTSRVAEGDCPYLSQVPQETRDTPRRIQRAEDLSEIGELSHKMLGVIAADGDDVGRILAELNSLAEYQYFAEKLYALSKGCVFAPLTEHLRAQKRITSNSEEWFHPFELIALGGDDHFLIVPANKAVYIAQAIATEWDGGKHKVVPPERSDIIPPTLSIGLLICPQTFPLYFMHQLAEQLLQRAKTARCKANASEGFVDFLILKSSGTPRTRAGQIQEALYRYPEGGGRGQAILQLTERPYGLSAFTQLVQTASTLKQAGMTRTQRHALARSLRLGRLRSTIDVLLYWARRSERDEKGRQIRQCLMEWLERLQVESARPIAFPWRQDEQRRRETWITQLLDVLELMEWVEVSENATTGNDGDMGAGDAA